MQLLAWIFRWPLVWTEDTCGAVRLRIAKKTVFGKWTAASIVYYAVVTLNPDGSTSGVSYVNRWKPANHIAKDVIPWIHENQEKIMSIEKGKQKQVYFELPKWAVLLDAETHEKVLEAPREYCRKVAAIENWEIVDAPKEEQ